MRYGFSTHKIKAKKVGCESAISSAGNIDLSVDNKRTNSTESSIHKIPRDGQTNLTDLLTNNSCLTYNDHEERHPSFGTIVKLKESNTTSSNLDLSLPSSPRQDLTFQHQIQNLPHLSNSLIPSPLQTKPNLRSASPRQATIKHPTPDLQALKSAHLKTIEHLERTAELLSRDSFTGKSTEDLLDKNLTNSLGELPLTSSSRKSLASRSPSISEDTKHGHLLPSKSPIDKIQHRSAGCRTGTSSKENSTMDIIGKMFEDFDGTHLDQINSDQSLTQNSGGRNSQRFSSAERLSYAGLELDPKMIYYPAPVPSVLNLPKKLSKRPTSTALSNRNSQSSCTIIQNLTSWQSGLAKQDISDNLEEYKHLSPNQNLEKHPKSHDLTGLPPHLLANQFFEHQNSKQEVIELKDDSAVATLDSILDASTHTPVSAFTDNVFARNSLQLSWSDQKRNSTLSYLKGKKDKPSKEVDGSGNQDDSSKAFETEPVSLNSNSLLDPNCDLGLSFEPLEDLKLGENLHEDDIQDETCENEVFYSPPTTLLAELQMRKQRQKQRTQPLTKTFPNGIHSTLLELDSAIQTEQKTRRKGRTILAWEDPAASESQAAMQDDEDVPLGILYPKNVAKNRPLGLLEKRELEDKESLSQRQNRLRSRLALSNRMDSNNNLAESNGLLANNNQAARALKKTHQLPLIDSAKTKNLADLPPALAPPNSIALPYFEKTAGSLLAIHERQAALRSASIQNLKHFSGSIKPQQRSSNNFNVDFQNQGVNQYYHLQQYPGQYSTLRTSAPIYPTSPISGNYAVGQSRGTNFNDFTMRKNNINPNMYMKNMSMNMPVLQPIEQGQMDRVERWRQSITPLVKPSV
ncbi:hypothetical protein OnM2_025077 [Erysiphe neolycopersici]|uniref:Uncharacterized protein n=1 Tax=Erysiphe neolycopersici TaxID=212602 RepID=A0A420I178_9PEZI|nr:hypothetical protein OnM2_025077 [Erysiphe neolycopersici]